MTLSSNWKVKIFTTSLIKSWSYEFSSLIDLKGIKKFNYCIRKNILALKAREAAKWPRTFYMVLTVQVSYSPTCKHRCVVVKSSVVVNNHRNKKVARAPLQAVVYIASQFVLEEAHNLPHYNVNTMQCRGDSPCILQTPLPNNLSTK